jgi:DNA-binding LacI/PurR family transcriptional regulator
VNSDESTGARLVVDRLIDLGHQRILHVDGRQGPNASRRNAGYSTAMKRVGLGANIEIFVADYTYESGQRAALTIAKAATRPTAVFAANDLNERGLISEFYRLGVGVASEISVVGYDDRSYVGQGDQELKLCTSQWTRWAGVLLSCF